MWSLAGGYRRAGRPSSPGPSSHSQDPCHPRRMGARPESQPRRRRAAARLAGACSWQAGLRPGSGWEPAELSSCCARRARRAPRWRSTLPTRRPRRSRWERPRPRWRAVTDGPAPGAHAPVCVAPVMIGPVYGVLIHAVPTPGPLSRNEPAPQVPTQMVLPCWVRSREGRANPRGKATCLTRQVCALHKQWRAFPRLIAIADGTSKEPAKN